MSTCKGGAALVCSDYSHLPHRLRFHAQLVIAALRRSVHSVKIESVDYSRLNSESLFRIFLQKRLLALPFAVILFSRRKEGSETHDVSLFDVGWSNWDRSFRKTKRRFRTILCWKAWCTKWLSFCALSVPSLHMVRRLRFFARRASDIPECDREALRSSK